MSQVKSADAGFVDRPPLTDTAPLSFAQQRLWLINELHPMSRAYNLRTAYSLRGDVDVHALKCGLAELVRRHEALRTTFEVVGGEPLQIVAPAGEIVLPVYDLSHVPTTERREHLQQKLHDYGARAFDLRRGPLMRAALFRSQLDEHVLLLVMHHIVFDDGSVPAFNRELTELYAAYHRGVAHQLAELPIQYPDFAVWQRESMRASDLARQLSYWRSQLANVPVRIELPLDRPRPALQRFAGAVTSTMLSASLSDDIRALGRAHGTTLFMTLLAAFNALLYRYTGQRDLVVGSPVANRTRSELEPLIGFFVNTIALRTRLSGESTFRDVLLQTRETAISAYENQDCPFEQIVAEVQPERSLSGTPIVNVMFFVRSALGEPLKLDGLHVKRFPLPSTSSRFDLALRVTETSGGLACSLQYDTDLFDAPKMERLLEHFSNLIASIVAAPDTAIGALPMLSIAERERIVVEWNATATGYAGDRTLAELFEMQAGSMPDAVAVADDRLVLTYRELNERSNRLAHELRANGLAAGEAVGVCTDRSVTMVVCTLAILKAAGAYLPLDADYPLERLVYMLRDANVRIVLTHRQLFSPPSNRLDIVVLDAEAPTVNERSADNVVCARSSDDIVYVMYTSGSTGRPKGVRISGRAVSRLVTGTHPVTIDAHDVVAQVSNVSFDAATFELWATLLNGARLEIIARATSLAPSAFASALAERGISVLFLTTALFRHVAGSVPAAFAGLRCLLVGGETLDPAAARAVLEAGGPAHLYNAYGPTETTTFACMYEVSLPVHTPIPIGRPIANTEAYILDEQRNSLPVGVAGQLYLGGPGLARDYLNDAELTARKFIAHPFSPDADARLYATGDIARYRPDGNIEYLGRIDRQVKIRGFRIEIDEIETALKGLPAVRDAFVFDRADEFGDKQLVAVVIDDEQPARTTATWRKLLGHLLPDYMLPNVVKTVAAFPLTSNGKIDVKALALLAAGNQTRESPAAAGSLAPGPLGEAQGALRALWERLLDVRPIDIRDNFFEHGGHSLLAVRLMNEIETTFHIRLPLTLLFEQPTIEHLADALCAEAAHREPEPAIAFNPNGNAQPLFFLHGSINGGGFYCRVLADRLGANRPLYAIAPQREDADYATKTIEAIAAENVALVKGIQSHGPYLLGGYCNGGLVAFEMARRLSAEGERVVNVILLDVPDARPGIRRIAEWIDHHGGRLRIGVHHRLRLIGALARVRHHRARFVASSTKVGYIKGRLGKLLQRVRLARSGAVDDALEPWFRRTEAFVPRRYDGRLTLLLTGDETRNAGARGWSALAPRVDTRSIRGSHVTCVSEFIDDTAQALAEALACEPE